MNRITKRLSNHGLPQRRSMLPAIILLLIVANVAAPAATITFQSSARRTSLLELYTSEGCSSCPPAESWLSRQKEAPGLWKDFVPVAFHVDYWDHLGWRDPWSDNSFTARQRAYAQAWGTNSIYTPELVLNGREWRDWSRWRDVARSEETVGVLTVSSVAGDRWYVSFTPTTPAGHYEVHAALLSSGMTSDVKAGENQGRHLAHDFVAASVAHARMEQTGAMFQADLLVGPEHKLTRGQLALAVWVTRDGQLEVLQAAGSWLPPVNQ